MPSIDILITLPPAHQYVVLQSRRRGGLPEEVVGDAVADGGCDGVSEGVGAFRDDGGVWCCELDRSGSGGGCQHGGSVDPRERLTRSGRQAGIGSLPESCGSW